MDMNNINWGKVGIFGVLLGAAATIISAVANKQTQKNEINAAVERVVSQRLTPPPTEG